MINRLIEPAQGTVYVEGKATTEWDPIPLRRRIGYVIKEIGLFPHFTVAENVALVPALQGRSKSEQATRAVELLEKVGLEPAAVRERFPAPPVLRSAGLKETCGFLRNPKAARRPQERRINRPDNRKSTPPTHWPPTGRTTKHNRYAQGVSTPHFPHLRRATTTPLVLP